MKRNLSIIITFLLIQSILVSGCKKFVTVDPPITQLVTGSVFDNDQTAQAAMNGIYGNMQYSGGFASGGTFSVGFLSGLSADELTNYSTTPQQIQFYQDALNKSNYLFYFLWGVPYQCIYDANGIMEGLAGSAQVSPALKKELTAEAKFIRAFSDFYLTSLFGNIPLINTIDYKTNSLAFRASKDSVYKQIIADLTDAQSLLATDYSYSNGERVRPNSWAATALLARVYLYSGDWADAEAQATAVINKVDLFSLAADLNQVFLANSPEAIWQLMPNFAQYNTNDGSTYILTALPQYATMSPQLLAAFEPGDMRKQDWVGDTTIASTTYYYPFKYKVAYGGTLTEYNMVLRLAEQYLIRAEARAKQNNISGSQDDLNAIRNRAGLPDIIAPDQASLLTAILHERQVELFTEWGNRWLDLIRSGQATTVLSTIKNNWQPTDTLYPIPQGDIKTDPNLTQNAGY